MVDETSSEKRSLVPGGALTDAVRVRTVSESGQGTSVILEDGTELLIKPAIVAVWRFLDAYDAQGLPIYQIQAGLVSSPVKIGEGLTKK